MTGQSCIFSQAMAKVTLQIVTVFSSSAMLAWLTWVTGSKSVFHLVWMLIVPLTIGFFFNRGLRRARMMILLPLASLVGIGLTANLIGYP
jgi:hypothetical protein